MHIFPVIMKLFQHFAYKPYKQKASKTDLNKEVFCIFVFNQ